MRVDVQAAAERLGGAIRFPTIAHSDAQRMDAAAFLGLHAHLQASYPRVHQRLTREVVEPFSLLYRWKGRGSGEGIALLAHMDVVPAEEATRGDWRYPPFDGVVADGYIWGRGALDMKGQLISIFEAVESLLQDGFKPESDVYLAFGHDEEIAAQKGSRSIARLLNERNVRLSMVFDEGGRIMDGAELGVEGTLALVGICEKGYMDVRISAEGGGGHSSTPPRSTALSRVCRAVCALEDKPMRARIDCAAPLLRALSAYTRFPRNMLYAHPRLFAGILAAIMSKSPFTRALTRTTMASTMSGASEASNVLPSHAWAVVNARNATGESIERVLWHMRKATRGVPVRLELLAGDEPTGRADVTAKPYRDVTQCVREVFPSMIVAPYPMLGGTDARMFEDVCGQILRFTPFSSFGEDRDTMHAAGERLSLQSLGEGIAFYRRLIEIS